MGLNDFLKAFSESAPSGDDLEYDPEFQALERAARSIATADGDDVPDYKDIAKQAQNIMERSHDLRAAMYFIQAQTRLTGFAGFAEGTGYIRGVLEGFWDSCYPELDHDDPDDLALARINTLRGFTEGATTMRAVREAWISESRMFGRVSLRGLEIAHGERTAGENETSPSDESAIAAALQDTPEEQLSEISAGLRQALEDMAAIDAVFDEKTPSQGPDFSPVIALLKKAKARLDEATGGDVEDIPEDVEVEEDPMTTTTTAPKTRTAASPGTITTTADVKKALDLILDYYRKNEPSSPLPILLERAKRLVGADFVTVLKDMAPDGVENVYLVGGITEDDSDEYE